MVKKIFLKYQLGFLTSAELSYYGCTCLTNIPRTINFQHFCNSSIVRCSWNKRILSILETTQETGNHLVERKRIIHAYTTIPMSTEMCMSLSRTSIHNLICPGNSFIFTIFKFLMSIMWKDILFTSVWLIVCSESFHPRKTLRTKALIPKLVASRKQV